MYTHERDAFLLKTKIRYNTYNNMITVLIVIQRYITPYIEQCDNRANVSLLPYYTTGVQECTAPVSVIICQFTYVKV